MGRQWAVNDKGIAFQHAVIGQMGRADAYCRAPHGMNAIQETRPRGAVVMFEPRLANLTQAILDSMVGSACVLDQTGAIVAVNQAWIKFGQFNGLLAPRSAIGINYIEVCRSDQSRLGRKITTGLSDILSGKQNAFACDYPCHSPTTQRWFEFRASLAHADGQTYVIVNHNPITPLKKTALRLRKRNRELKAMAVKASAAAMAKSEFLANMSHEIRTPLTGVLGFAGLLEKLPDLPETARSYAGRIATSGQALLSVVNDILDFSKLEADRVELDPHPFDPAALVAETVELVAAEAGRKGLALTTEVEGEPPAAVLADSARVRQVLLNLLSNAIKFTKAGQITIKLGYRPEAGGALRVAVADSGIGIPADQVDRLFQRFSQVDGSNTRVHGGTGLGLSISKALTELMGGQIGVESREGEGSTFWFTLAAPRAELARPEPAAAAEAQAPVAVGARILVVDDVAMNRELVRTMLAAFAYDITEAANGADAVRAAVSAPFDLILMDLQMPGMDGLAATRAIRATSDFNQQTPIVALSANVLPLHIAECRAAGMDDHIAKPISPAELLTKIAHWTRYEEVDTPQSVAR